MFCTRKGLHVLTTKINNDIVNADMNYDIKKSWYRNTIEIKTLHKLFYNPWIFFKHFEDIYVYLVLRKTTGQDRAIE